MPFTRNEVNWRVGRAFLTEEGIGWIGTRLVDLVNLPMELPRAGGLARDFRFVEPRPLLKRPPIGRLARLQFVEDRALWSLSLYCDWRIERPDCAPVGPEIFARSSDQGLLEAFREDLLARPAVVQGVGVRKDGAFRLEFTEGRTLTALLWRRDGGAGFPSEDGLQWCLWPPEDDVRDALQFGVTGVEWQPRRRSGARCAFAVAEEVRSERESAAAPDASGGTADDPFVTFPPDRP